MNIWLNSFVYQPIIWVGKAISRLLEFELECVTFFHEMALGKKATIHQVTAMLATSKNVLFPGHNHLLTTSADEPTLWLSLECQRKWRVISTFG